MLKKIVFGIAFLVFTHIAISQSKKSNTTATNNSGKMEQVTVSPRNSKSDTRWERVEKLLTSSPDIGKVTVETVDYAVSKLSESAFKLQKKYADMLDVMPSSLSNLSLIKSIDYWFGTRYLYGGTTKRGVDCSAFVRAALSTAFGYDLPRTARQQYYASERISATELREGDLVFFNTTGGISHVGIYLKNNKFAHSSSSRGVTISDLYESYYMARFIGGGRIEKSSKLADNGNSKSKNLL
ncbi:MAG: C40 family peptidase [Niabella sp.]